MKSDTTFVRMRTVVITLETQKNIEKGTSLRRI